MTTKGIVLGLIAFVLSVFFGLNEEAVNSVVNWLDPPPAGLARVEEVIDGDTAIVRFGEGQERVRFIGVDTPETNHPDKAVQCFGQAATDYLTDLIEGENVRLEADPTNTNRDRYDRLLRYVYLEDGTLVNQKIISEGYGFAYTAFPFQKMDLFNATERQARDSGAGLWSACEVEESGDFINTVPAEVGG